jgi:type I restriction enzyme, S subunit
MDHENNSQFSPLHSPLPKGYKQTEVGVIPEDWSQSVIGELAIKVGSGITPRGGSNKYKKYGRPFVRSQNVGWGNLFLDDMAYIDEETHNSFSSTELKEGDVLLNITGASIGRSALADTRLVGGNVNQHVCIIRTNPKEIVPIFINFFLLSVLGQRQIDSFQAGGNREGLNFGQIKSIKLPLPSTKAEQEAIAEALSDADALIESLTQLIAKKRQLKQGAMQELLTGKRRLHGFANATIGYKQTEVGMIPEDWKIHQLGDIGTFKNGINKDSRAFGHGSPFVNLMDVFGVSAISSTERLGLVASNNVEQTNYNLKRGDVIFIRSSVKPSGVGLTAVVEKDLPETVYSGFLIRFRDGSVIDTNFKRHCFYEEGFRKRVIGASSVSANTNINQDNLMRLFIPLPPTKAEQEAIAEALSEMDTEITALETKLAKARDIKQGMMHNLLTGRIRLV